MQEAFFLQAAALCVPFVVWAFLTDDSSQWTSRSIAHAPLQQLASFVLLALLSHHPFCSFSWHRPRFQDFFSFASSGLPRRALCSFFLPSHRACSCSMPPPPSPAAGPSFSSASYAPGRLHSAISSGGLGVRVCKLTLNLPPSQPAWNGKCDKWNHTRLNFVWKFQT